MSNLNDYYEKLLSWEGFVITSPPFLNTVNYVQDNWLRMWFCNIKVDRGKIWQFSLLKEWGNRMRNVFVELRRILRSGGRIAFEVGEIRDGSLLLEDEVIRVASDAGLVPEKLFINSQSFTKTANCWGVTNNKKGTNSNRIVAIKKEF